MFENSIRLNNLTLYDVVSSTEIVKFLSNKSNLMFSSACGEIQRNLDESHVETQLNFQLEHFKKNNCYFFPSIKLAKYQNKYSILDGQHRIKVIEKLLKYNNSEFKIFVEIVSLKSIEEYDYYFEIINKNKPVILINNVSWKTVIKGFEEYLLKNYKHYFETSSHNPQIPNINMDDLKIQMDTRNIISRIGLNLKDFIILFEELNSFYSTYSENIKIKDLQTKIKRCQKSKAEKYLFVGIFRKFEWLEFMVLKKDSKEFNFDHIPIGYREKITKSTKNLIWSNYNSSSLKGKCYCCQTDVTYDNFECGHVVSVFEGGKNTEENLRPICSSCNNDMGLENLEEYKIKILNEQSY